MPQRRLLRLRGDPAGEASPPIPLRIRSRWRPASKDATWDVIFTQAPGELAGSCANPPIPAANFCAL